MDDSSKDSHSRAQAYYQSLDAQVVKSDASSAGSKRIPFGLDSFGPQPQDEFGRHVRLAMGLMDGLVKSPGADPFQPAMPKEPLPLGCDISQHLQIHHIHHWADGGSTCIDNGVCLCQKHHAFVHEGGYRIERVDGHAARLDEQFARQQATEQTYNEAERWLRNSRESFDRVRSLSPTRFRFRVMDKNGRDIRDSHALYEADHDCVNTTKLSTRGECRENDNDCQWPHGRPAEWIRQFLLA